MTSLENLIASCLNEMFESLFAQFRLYLKKQSLDFLVIQPGQNPYISNAKRNLLDFEANVLKAVTHIGKLAPGSSPLKSPVEEQKLSYPTFDDEKAEAILEVVQKPNVAKHIPAQVVKSILSIHQTPQFQTFAAKLNQVTKEEKPATPREQKTVGKSIPSPKREEPQVLLDPLELEQTKSLKSIHSKIGRYLKSTLTLQKCSHFRESIAQYRTAKYFNIRGHRDKMFAFYKALLSHITELYATSSQPVTQQPNDTDAGIGSKFLSYLTEDRVDRIKYALKNCEGSEVKNFPEKLIMFDALEMMMQLIGQ